MSSFEHQLHASLLLAPMPSLDHNWRQRWYQLTTPAVSSLSALARCRVQPSSRGLPWTPALHQCLHMRGSRRTIRASRSSPPPSSHTRTPALPAAYPRGLRPRRRTQRALGSRPETQASAERCARKHNEVAWRMPRFLGAPCRVERASWPVGTGCGSSRSPSSA
jgi:hypothetical protein